MADHQHGLRGMNQPLGTRRYAVDVHMASGGAIETHLLI